MGRILTGIVVGAVVVGGAAVGTSVPWAVYGAAGRPAATGAQVPAVPSCAVSYTLTAGWPGGFLAELRITNLGAVPVTGWNLAFDLPSGQTVVRAWGMLHSQRGATVMLSNAAFNGTVAPGGTVVAALQGASRPDTGIVRPSGFALNGRPCRIG